VGPQTDIHALWTAAGTLAPLEIAFDLHEFLDYCALLRKLRDEFTRHDTAFFFDACLFFLRGSYGLWAYLNTARNGCDLSLRATVFGGLNPGPTRKVVFRQWLHGALTQTIAAGRRRVDLAIVDEVDSGTGIGTQMKAIHHELRAWPGPSVDVSITYIAVARPDHRASELASTIRRWGQALQYRHATLSVAFHTLVGTLIAYDDDELLGIARRKHGYEVIRRAGSTIAARCPTYCHRDCVLMVATAGTQNESIANFAAAIASSRDTPAVRSLDVTIARRGCPQCASLWAPLRPRLATPHLSCRERFDRMGRAICRKLPRR
jgi:hypothetical protein